MAKKKVFVVMPFSSEFFDVYDLLKTQFQDKYDFSNASEEGNQQNVLKDVVQPILDADIVIADLTNLNPNVMYELGLSHALNKKTIIITQDNLNNLPFDLKQYRAKDYSTHFKKINDLTDYLKRTLDGYIDGSILFSNPVQDFLSINDRDLSKRFTQDVIVQPQIDNDKGFLDLFAEIESDSNNLITNISGLTEGLNEMGEGVTSSLNELNKMKSNGRDGDVSFVLKQARTVSTIIEKFDLKLKKYNKENDILWDKLEKNSLGLLDSKYATSEDNKEGVINYIRSLIELKSATKESRTSITYLIDIMNQLDGIERSISHAVRFCVQDLAYFTAFTERMETSIDNIENKSRHVIGNIN